MTRCIVVFCIVELLFYLSAVVEEGFHILEDEREEGENQK